MNKNSVLIKGNKYGLVILLDSITEFEIIKKQLAEKISEASKFFEQAKLAISFEGRNLTTDEQKELVNIITENSSINIICIMDNNQNNEIAFKKKVDEKLHELSLNTGQFYKGILRSGQLLEVEHSIVIIGDINPGAKIVSKGNIVVIGTLKGTAYAGINGDENAYVVALRMNPIQIKIGNIIARSPDYTAKNQSTEPQIAYIEDGSICIESIKLNK